jgi:isopenicillin-N N-acyltransferase-like protein
LIHDEGTGFIAHSNHYVCSKYATEENHAKCTKDSFTRLDRMNALIREKFGSSITADDVKGFLSDYDRHPTSICRHPRTDDVSMVFETAGMTAASIVAEPAQRRMHVSLGNHCESKFVTYAMD